MTRKTKKTERPVYPFTVRPLSEEEGSGFLLEFPDLPGCMTDGETLEEALANSREAIESWIAAAKENGDPVPPPGTFTNPQNYSGKLVQRMPKSLHMRLAQRARQEGVSLNQLILSMIAEGLGHRDERR
jgi:antitoxin HicB